jgi:hypothetical protein
MNRKLLFALLAALLCAPSADAANRMKAKGAYFGCKKQDDFDRIARFARDDDELAYKTALFAGLWDDVCTLFEEGEVVFQSEHGSFLSGRVKVRRKGETAEYWTHENFFTPVAE